MNRQEAKAIVLEWLKNRAGKAELPLVMITGFGDDHFDDVLPDEVEQAYRSLSRKDDFEILAEFAAWGLKEEELMVGYDLMIQPIMLSDDF
ncbi:hypothetical protein LJH24_002392 [Listeria monocytogenes]|uniref:hypothetical protein n=1 Tax=Listeria monocytogenes TaxID=1639 RepID=UPI0018869D8C|nr:hypothetical protein [Listeria monocytogenes]EHM0718797.1 hypothetical protein [Listeria monocytogenes]EHM4665773.1 hypothetical protein [Listeria monocytogenes]EHU6441399.1 hypothetical protein [Listeria monocytogenes]EIA7886279.1 hypothetical protein [Listeria monocytogenes]EIJ5162207.1 hypothetical protein [Listeria monocytogenes]